MDTERRREFAAYRALEGGDVPVPRTWWVEEDPGVLGGPFFVMDAVEGCEAAPMKMMQPPYLEHHDDGTTRSGRSWAGSPAPTPCAWVARSTRWTPRTRGGASSTTGAGSSTATRSSRNRSRRRRSAGCGATRRPQPAQKVSVVHGDYRTGNLLVAPDGTLRAGARLGDGPPRRPARGPRLEPEPVLELRRSRPRGRDRDPRAGDRVVGAGERPAGGPGCAALVGTARVREGAGDLAVRGAPLSEGDGTDLMLAFAAWIMMNSQDRAILALMGHLE